MDILSPLVLSPPFGGDSASRPALRPVWILMGRRRLAPDTGLFPPDLYAAARLRILERVPGLGGVFFRTPPPAPRVPYVVQTPVSSVESLNSSENYWVEERVQYDVTATTMADAESLGKAARDALSPHLPMLEFQDGYEMACWPGGVRHTDPNDPEAQYAKRYRYMFEYNFLVGRTFPTE